MWNVVSLVSVNDVWLVIVKTAIRRTLGWSAGIIIGGIGDEATSKILLEGYPSYVSWFLVCRFRRVLPVHEHEQQS